MTARQRRVRARLAEITLGTNEAFDGASTRSPDGMSRPWMDNLPSKDMKSRTPRAQGQAMQTEDDEDVVEGMADEYARAQGKTPELKAAMEAARLASQEKDFGRKPLKEGIERCECADCGSHPCECSNAASFVVRRGDITMWVCSDCLSNTDRIII